MLDWLSIDFPSITTFAKSGINGKRIDCLNASAKFFLIALFYAYQFTIDLNWLIVRFKIFVKSWGSA